MRLVDLEPQFIVHKVVEARQEYWYVDSIAEADGVMFLCPKCFAAHSGPVGTHRVVCWRPRVPPDVTPKPGRWELTGSGYGDLTLVAGSSSVQLLGGCNAHFFVQAGNIVLV